MKHVQLVEDDDGIAELVEGSLGREGLGVDRFRDAESALLALTRSEPDAIVLDLGLPGLDGLEFCRLVRRTRRTPILILTSRREEVDKVLGLELGADDYVTKPFGVRELVARVRALLRRAEPAPEAVRRFGSLAIDTAGKTVTRRLTEDQYQAFRPWFEASHTLRALLAELEALSLDIIEDELRSGHDKTRTSKLRKTPAT